MRLFNFGVTHYIEENIFTISLIRYNLKVVTKQKLYKLLIDHKFMKEIHLMPNNAGELEEIKTVLDGHTHNLRYRSRTSLTNHQLEKELNRMQRYYTILKHNEDGDSTQTVFKSREETKLFYRSILRDYLTLTCKEEDHNPLIPYALGSIPRVAFNAGIAYLVGDYLLNLGSNGSLIAAGVGATTRLIDEAKGTHISSATVHMGGLVGLLGKGIDVVLNFNTSPYFTGAGVILANLLSAVGDGFNCGKESRAYFSNQAKYNRKKRKLINKTLKEFGVKPTKEMWSKTPWQDRIYSAISFISD